MNLTGWTLLFATAISTDGLTIAGFGTDPNGITEAWIATIPDPSRSDADNDGVVDGEDNCVLIPNPDQLDADHDGFGNACDADLNNDNVVNFADLARLKQAFFTSDPIADLNGDGVVNFADLAIMKQAFFKNPGPAAGKP